MSEWQPIETAPKDGGRFLVAHKWKNQPIEITIVHWGIPEPYPGPAWITDEEEGYCSKIQQEDILGWMPLPDPPEITYER